MLPNQPPAAPVRSPRLPPPPPPPGSSGLRIDDIEVPSLVLPSDTIHLKCIFHLEKDHLYSVTWWRGQKQFYQYSPTTGKAKYEDKGITVDEMRSSMETVVLRNVSLATSGMYKCEVVAERTYEKDSKSQAMEVVDIPDRLPLLQVSRSQYSKGDELVANCTSPGAKPKPTIQWSINGKEVHGLYVKEITEGRSVFGLFSPTSELRLILRQDHFVNGQVKLTCSSTISHVYQEYSHVAITMTGFKTVAPSQKLYGKGFSHVTLSLLLRYGIVSKAVGEGCCRFG
nr:uncharacterized protein LOC113819238 [Penaeus vannamei]